MIQHLRIGTVGFLLLGALVNPKCGSKQRPPQSELVLAATVERVGQNPGVSSGVLKIYQLAKYRVVGVCRGTYNEKEIVVDHLLVTGDELRSLHVGDKVYLTLQPSKTIEMRVNEEGLRSTSENVGTFYIGHQPDVAKPAQCEE
jgi:hypothetical protein